MVMFLKPVDVFWHTEDIQCLFAGLGSRTVSKSSVASITLLLRAGT